MSDEIDLNTQIPPVIDETEPATPIENTPEVVTEIEADTSPVVGEPIINQTETIPTEVTIEPTKTVELIIAPEVQNTEAVTPPVVEEIQPQEIQITNPVQSIENTPTIQPESTPITQPEPISVIIGNPIQNEPTVEKPIEIQEPVFIPQTEVYHAPVVEIKEENIIKKFLFKMLEKANLATKNRNKKRLEILTTFFENNPRVTNNMVEKLLKVSDSTATMYLKKLKNQGKIIQHGKHGSGVFYTKV